MKPKRYPADAPSQFRAHATSTNDALSARELYGYTSGRLPIAKKPFKRKILAIRKSLRYQGIENGQPVWA